MIVSGFTRRELVTDTTTYTDMPGQHSHCVLCRQVNCKQVADNVTSCDMSSCPHCHWRFHSCKSEEHELTCQEARVVCVNAGNGCPHVIKRCQMAQHLQVCPACVVSCAEEWSRWPMHSKEQGVRHSLPPSKTYIDCGQLDVGLAMRDQRMLIDSLKAPRKLKRSLRNPLTLKYPAAPFAHRGGSSESDLRASGDTSQTVSDDESDTPWDLNKNHPGLQASICNQLFKVSKETADKLATALNLASDIVKNDNDKKGDVNVDKGDHADAVNCNSDIKVTNSFANNAALESENERSSLSPDRGSDMSRSRSVSVLRDEGGTQLHKITGEKFVDGSQEEISLHKILGVNLTHEVINKYVKKPQCMYTFICAQNFRRDEYKWHFKNIHQDIHQGMHGWIQQRCPLAYLGCTFSFQRLIPEQPNVMLHHSWLQESFGLKSLSHPVYPLYDEGTGPSLAESCFNSNNLSDCHPHPHQHCQEPQKKTNAREEQASISDLGHFDKEFLNIPKASPPGDSDAANGCGSIARNGNQSVEEEGSGLGRSQSCDEGGCELDDRESVMSVRPVMFTSCNPESKVIVHYNVEECPRNIGPSPIPALTGLPFEIIQFIAKQLDSFSLCNLSLTCRRLREVCCSLLDDHGIVLLNWERQKMGDKITWKVSNKRWMFSTSFEPIKKWKFNPDQPSVADHLKICPYNKDCNTHSGPNKVLMT